MKYEVEIADTNRYYCGGWGDGVMGPCPSLGGTSHSQAQRKGDYSLAEAQTANLLQLLASTRISLPLPPPHTCCLASCQVTFRPGTRKKHACALDDVEKACRDLVKLSDEELDAQTGGVEGVDKEYVACERLFEVQSSINQN